MRPESLDAWLGFIQAQHPADIDLGLERPRKVFERLIELPLKSQTITVAGTNGKGTTVAMLESLASVHNLSVVSFTSPHLFDYRERIKHNSKLLPKQVHCDAFANIHRIADGIPLTYFEYSTLAAFLIAQQLQPDLLVLEVGLGGRLDAVNLIATDIAIVTTIDYDHQEYLGNTLTKIANEKLGVVHPNTQLVVADNTIPEECLTALKAAAIYTAGRDFSYVNLNWQWLARHLGPWQVSFEQKPSSNPAAAVAAFSLLQNQSLTMQQLSEAASKVQLAGRFQKINSAPDVYVDVAHNPQSIAHLVQRQVIQDSDEIYLVLGMLADKSILEVLTQLKEINPKWYLCELDSPRSWSLSKITEQLPELGISLSDVTCYASVIEAYEQAFLDAERTQATMVVLGSFHTVGPVLKQVSTDVE